MTRRPIQVLVAAAAVLSAVAAAVGGAGAASAQTRASVASTPLPAALTNPICHHALDPANRSLAATAVVHGVSGASRVAIEFRLLRRLPGARFDPVQASGLNAWMSKPLRQASDTWRLIHTVSDLSVPAAYRFAVGFRWIGSGGQILDHTVRFGRICHQPELRPDLQVLAIDVLADATNSQDDVYRAQIHDAGATGAGPFRVQLTEQGAVVSTRRVLRIRAHRSLWVRLVGPLCNSSKAPVVTVDPGHRVNVSSRSQSSRTAVCPAPAAAVGT